MKLNIAGINVSTTKYKDKVVLTLSTIDGIVDFCVNMEPEEIDKLCEILQDEKNK